MAAKVARFSLCTLLLAALLSLSAPAGAQSTTVLGLYHEWQTQGLPDGVKEVYYDSETEQLVVVLQKADSELCRQIEGMVSDPENIRFEIAPSIGNELSDAEKRWRGVLALLGAYGVCGVVLVLFIVARHKNKKRQGDQEKDVISRMTDFFDPKGGAHG